MTSTDSSRLSPEDLPEALFERCLRALYHAPEDKPSLPLLLDMHGPDEGLRAAIALAFAAGRESLGQLWATDERPAYTTRLWADDGDTWAHGSSGALRGTPEFEQSVIADAREQIGPWDDTCHIVRVEVQRFREVTYRVDPTVIARFGDWEKVPDA